MKKLFFLFLFIAFKTLANDLFFTIDRESHMQLPMSMVQSGNLLIKQQNIKSEVIEVYDIVRKKKVKYVGYALSSLKTGAA